MCKHHRKKIAIMIYYVSKHEEKKYKKNFNADYDVKEE